MNDASETNDNRLAIVQQALRHTEMRLEDLEKNATSAETRLGWFTTLSVALGSVSFLYSQNLPSPGHAFIGGVVFLASAVFAVWTALPRNFHIRGHYWFDWKAHIDDGDDILSVLVSQAEENDDRVVLNETELARMATRFRLAFIANLYAIVFIIFGQLYYLI